MYHNNTFIVFRKHNLMLFIRRKSSKQKTKGRYPRIVHCLWLEGRHNLVKNSYWINRLNDLASYIKLEFTAQMLLLTCSLSPLTARLAAWGFARKKSASHLPAGAVHEHSWHSALHLMMAQQSHHCLQYVKRSHAMTSVWAQSQWIQWDE